MAFLRKPTPTGFERQLKDIIKSFPKSDKTIRASIEEILKNPLSGDRIPGLGSFHLRKIRLPIPEYNISKRRGLRVILLLVNHGKDTNTILIAIYYKGDNHSEGENRKTIKKSLKEILDS